MGVDYAKYNCLHELLFFLPEWNNAQRFQPASVGPLASHAGIPVLFEIPAHIQSCKTDAQFACQENCLLVA